MIQHTEYIAFGEVLVDEHSVNPTQPYLFNGKELDYETGLYYYGARYYDAKTSLWLNVDPLAEKYPHVSPYTYTLNNPIKYIDPDGRDIVPSKAFLNSKYGRIYNQLIKNNNIYKNILSKYSKSKDFNFYLEYGDKNVSIGANATTRTNRTFSIIKQGNKVIDKNIKSIKSESFYGESVLNSGNYERSEIAMAGTLIHEALHAKIATTFKNDDDNHTTFMEYHTTYLDALKEYNRDNNLDYTDQQLNDLSWEGSKKSKQFRNYIEKNAKTNGTTYEEELKSYNNRVNEVIWNEKNSNN